MGVRAACRRQACPKGQGIVLNCSTEKLIKLLLGTTSEIAVNAADVMGDEVEFLY